MIIAWNGLREWETGRNDAIDSVGVVCQRNPRIPKRSGGARVGMLAIVWRKRNLVRILVGIRFSFHSPSTMQFNGEDRWESGRNTRD
jgi:hypothetical protein